MLCICRAGGGLIGEYVLMASEAHILDSSFSYACSLGDKCSGPFSLRIHSACGLGCSGPFVASYLLCGLRHC